MLGRKLVPKTPAPVYAPSSSLRSPISSTDSEREASEVRLEEAAEATLGGLLPGSRLTQCSHKEELVEPVIRKGQAGESLRGHSPREASLFSGQRGVLAGPLTQAADGQISWGGPLSHLVGWERRARQESEGAHPRPC